MENVKKVDNNMLSTKQRKVIIPKYSLSEELMNAITHGLGAAFGIVALILCIIKSVSVGNTVAIVSSSIFGGSLIITYLISTIYHSLKVNGGKRVFRVLDHCSIFILISGTYTPYTLVTLGSLTIGRVIFCLVWGLSILGIVLNAVDLKKYSKISCACYVIIGWIIIFAFKTLMANLAINGIILLIVGGVAYTIGAILYVVGSKKKYFHSVFHLFCLIGSVLHFLSIIMYVIN